VRYVLKVLHDKGEIILCRRSRNVGTFMFHFFFQSSFHPHSVSVILSLHTYAVLLPSVKMYRRCVKVRKLRAICVAMLY